MVPAKNKKYHIALYAYGGYLAVSGFFLTLVAGLFKVVLDEVALVEDDPILDMLQDLPGVFSKYTFIYTIIGVLFLIGGYQLSKLKDVSIVLIRIASIAFVIQLIYFLLVDYHLLVEALPQIPVEDTGLVLEFDDMIGFSSVISLLTQLAPAVLIFIFINPKYLAEQRALQENKLPPAFNEG